MAPWGSAELAEWTPSQRPGVNYATANCVEVGDLQRLSCLVWLLSGHKYDKYNENTLFVAREPPHTPDSRRIPGIPAGFFVRIRIS